ncbi:hypothetical protein OKW21_000374 [Catalinimonas alkaloidigena]|uniref:hypothetical protein n=1 Tax=Catalinimonas alkaloidigena TaxID=1075417 RepID=UPI002405A66B|nr:hypothetical protein [Catalinimonas alkaloidigena]MDF9795111.1 hypothetical protein [Catalinimonas alkaloidigena]
MIQTFTLDDVVRFLYDEMNEDEAHKFQESMLLDSELMDEYQQMLIVKSTLDSNPVREEPRQSSIDKILNYSRSYNLQMAEE